MATPFFRKTFRITRNRPDTSRDVRDEIEFHIEMRTQELVDEGWEPEAAQQHCLELFGNRSQIEDSCRRIAGTMDRRRNRALTLESVLADLRIAGRDLRKRPVFFTASTLTLAMAMALFTLIYCVADTVLLRPLPYLEPDRLLTIYNSYPLAGAERGLTSAVDFLERRDLKTVEDVALFQNRSHAYGEEGTRGRAFSQSVTPSFFEVLGARPRLGTFFSEQELLPGRTPQAVISSTLWEQAFQNDPDVIGKILIIEGVPHTVIAVTQPDFSFPDWDVDLWVPISFRPEQREESARLWNNYRMLARLAPGVGLEQAQAELEALDAAILERTSPEIAQQLTQAGYTAHIVPFHDDLVRDVRPWILLLLAGATFVLLVAGISLSNLQLVRITRRLPELATRFVLGADRPRLLRQLLTENLLTTVAGAGLGIATGMWGLRFLSGFDPWEIPRISQLSLSPFTTWLLGTLALVAMTVSSLLASWMLQRSDLFYLMRQGASPGTREQSRWRGGLVAAQVAAAFILLAGASLLTVSLQNLLSEDLGFDAENVQSCALILPNVRYESAADRRDFVESLIPEIESIPSVRHAALSTQRPFSGGGSRRVLTPEQPPADGEKDQLIASYHASVSPGFFDTLGIQRLAGRTFNSSDRHDATPVIVVSEAVAQRHWPPGQALGQRVQLGESDKTWWTVIGVVEEIRQESVVEPQPVGAIYLPLQQSDSNFMHLLVQADSLAKLAPALRQRVQKLDPETPLFWYSTLAEDVASSLISVRLPLQILLIFAAVALALAAVGIFGVLSQAVTCRTKEIGIRLALGSSRDQIWRWVFLHLTRFVVVGWALGLAAALALSSLIQSLVYGVRPHEPWVFLVVSGLLLAVAYGVALLPALKASRIDPCRVLTAAAMVCFLLLTPIAEADSSTPPVNSEPTPTQHIYASPEGTELSLYIFGAPGAADAPPRPAMLVFHGGGWTIGSAEWAFPRARHFASQGMVSIAVQYRLSDQKDVTPLDAMSDTRAAFRWLRKHASEHGVDPQRIGAYGWSAGAHLAAAAAAIPGPESAQVSASPDALILVSPAVAVTDSDWMRQILLDRAATRDVSPDQFVRPALPPTIILQGRTDTVTPTPGVERYCQRLEQAGNRCDLHIFEDVGHLFTPSSEPDNDWPNPDPQVRAEAYRAADEFLASIGWIDR